MQPRPPQALDIVFYHSTRCSTRHSNHIILLQTHYTPTNTIPLDKPHNTRSTCSCYTKLTPLEYLTAPYETRYTDHFQKLAHHPMQRPCPAAGCRRAPRGRTRSCAATARPRAAPRQPPPAASRGSAKTGNRRR